MRKVENHPLLKEKTEWKINLGLDRVRRICKKLGNPHLETPSIIVGGTNGKGFVVNFLHHLLSKTGLRIGSYYSPHLERITERIHIEGREISEDELIQCMDEVYKVKKSEGIELTYFEALTCSAFLYFSNTHPDLLILEVGLGGKLDATNIAEPEMSIITNVSYDHERFLGDTLEQIAEEKTGIVRKGKILLTGEDNPYIISSASKKLPSEIKALGKDFHINVLEKKCIYSGKQHLSFKIPAPYPEAFIKNIALSLAVAENMEIELNKRVIEETIQIAKWAGRMELVKNSQSFLLDGGHNPHAVCELLKFIEQIGWENPLFLVGFMKDKRIEEILKMIKERSYNIYAVPMPYNRSWNPKNYEKYCNRIFKSPDEGLISAIQKGDNIVICGSLYLVGLLRKKVINYTGNLPLNLK